MDVRQMHHAIDIGVQMIDSHRNDDLLPDEIDYYLNKATTDFIKQQYSIIKSKPSTLESENALENIQTIIDIFDGTNLTAGEFPNSYFLEFPPDYNYHINSYVEYSQGSFKVTRVVSYSELNTILNTDSNIPFFRLTPVMIKNNGMLILNDDDDSISSVKVFYIKQPEKISHPDSDSGTEQNSVLPEHTHETLIELALQSIFQHLNIALQQ